MSLPLAHFPREILAEITAHVSALDIVIRLYGCGDSTLTTKLKTGGVTSLHYQGPLLPQSRIDFIQSLQLDSFVISGRLLPETATTQLVQGMAPSLRRLTIDVADIGRFEDQIYLDSKLVDFSPSAVPIRTYPCRAWIVCNTFPKLEAFTSSKLLPDPFVHAEFLAGLPSSLTELEIPITNHTYLNTHIALPPLLTRLSGHISLTPHNSPPLDHLTTLDVDISSSSKEKMKLGRWRLPSWSEERGEFPPSLISLHLTCSSTKLLSLPVLPRHLETLMIDISTGTVGFKDLDELFQVAPPSVTDLRIDPPDGSHFSFKPQSFSNAANLVRPAVKVFHMQLEHLQDPISDFVLSLPNVQDFKVSADEADPDATLGLSTIRRFNGALLHSLEAPINWECFLKGDDGAYPLAALLPSLTRLRLSSVEPESQVFDFGAIPHTVTHFRSDCEYHDTSTLHLLPPSVTNFGVREGIAVSIHASNFRQLFGSASPTMRASIESPLGRRLVIRQSYSLTRMEDGLLTCSPSIGAYSISEIRTVWPTSMSGEFFEAYTDLKDTTGIKFTLPATPRPSPLLASLTRLHLTNHQSRLFDMAPLVGLVDLKLSTFWGTVYPPNLTRFQCSGSATLPVPLPPSITHLICGYQPQTVLQGLNSLQILENITDRYSIRVWSPPYPSTLTELRLPWGSFGHSKSYSWLESQFFSPSPLLKRLHLHHPVPLALAEGLLQTAPLSVEVTFHSIAAIADSNFEAAGARAGLSTGGLSLLPHETLENCMLRVINRAYKPFIVHENTTNLANLTYASWTSIHRYLHENTTMLSLKDLATLIDPQNRVELPPNITALVCDLNTILPATPFILPSQLQKLEIKSLKNNRSLEEDFHPLPNLTHLALSGWKVRSPSYPWPSTLKYLHIGFHQLALDTSIASLPSELNHLSVHKVQFPVRLAKSLPKALKRFEGSVAGEERETFLVHAREAGFTWIVPHTELTDQFQSIDFESSFDTLTMARISPNRIES